MNEYSQSTIWSQNINRYLQSIVYRIHKINRLKKYFSRHKNIRLYYSINKYVFGELLNVKIFSQDNIFKVKIITCEKDDKLIFKSENYKIYLINSEYTTSLNEIFEYLMLYFSYYPCHFYTNDLPITRKTDLEYIRLNQEIYVERGIII